MKTGNHAAPLVGHLVKSASGQIPGSSFGFEYAQQRYPELNKFPHDRLLELFGNSGAKWARVRLPWPQLEVSEHVYDWSVLDTVIDGLVERGVRVYLGTECMAHPLYQEVPPGKYIPVTDSPRALDEFCRHAAGLVKRYHTRVRHFEIWNEPNHPGFWVPEPDPKAYALLVRRTAAAMRQVDPTITIIAGALAGSATMPEFAHAFLSEPDTASWVDVLTFHNYNPIPETLTPLIQRLRAAIQKVRPEIRIWNGESACPSSGDSLFARGAHPWGLNIQAKWALRRYLCDMMEGFEASIYYPMVENRGTLRPSEPESGLAMNTKGVIQYGNWQPKPAYYAIQNLATTIDDSWQQTGERVEVEILRPGCFFGIGPHETRFPCSPYTMTWRREKTPRLALWLPWRPQELIRRASVRLSWPGVQWQEPVAVDLLDGTVFRCERSDNGIIGPLADYPMIYTERASLEIDDTPHQPSYDQILEELDEKPKPE